MPMAALALALAFAGPNGLQVLHSPSAEDYQQRQLLDRLRDAGTPVVNPGRQQTTPPPPADVNHDAAWRADHLTCVSPKGRTPGQYQRECGAWLAGQAERGAAR
jgi:hypothetical protein